MKALSVRQRDVLRFLETRPGDPPSHVEIGAALGIHGGGIGVHLRRLEAKGYIERAPGLSRAIRVRHGSDEARRAPIVEVSPIVRCGECGAARSIEIRHCPICKVSP